MQLIRYHGARDKRLPVQFICFDCRLRGSHEWDIITGKIHADMIARYKDLALFRYKVMCRLSQNYLPFSRRAIKIYEAYQPSSASLFREHIGQFNFDLVPHCFIFMCY